jgi:citrate lyase subunit beta/citryl-CoA lyase
MTEAVARSWLFVPGDRPERFEKARSSGADEIIIDLEDAVEPARKEGARQSVVAWLGGASAWVRINPVGTSWHTDDVAALRGAPGLRGVVLPKSEDPSDLESLAAAMSGGTPVMPLVETALGLSQVSGLARCAAIARIAFGSIDFCLDIGCDESEEALLFARSHLVLASKLAGLPPPVDGVTVDVADPAAASVASRHARALGFGGKLCIHPSQIEPVARAWRHSADEVAWARRVVEASSDGGAVRLDGRLVDRPVVERARRLLAEVES